MIISKQNALIKLIRSLSDKKFRDKNDLYIIESVKLVKEALSLGLNIKTVVCTEKGLSALGQAGESCDCLELISDELFKYISQETTPQGALALVEKPENRLTKPTKSCILLDGVSDPNNVGAIIRTAVASGYREIYMTDSSADPFSPKAVKCSMSGVFRASIIRGELSQLLSVIKLPIIVADMGGENVFTAKVQGDFCLVIGNEGHGVSQKLKDLAQKVVSIPMQNDMESLNASVSAGILMYSLLK